MKAKVVSIIFAVILLLIACKKEKPDIDIPHWPVIKTMDITNLTLTAATLNGTVNGYGLPTIVTFEYDTNSDIYDIPTSYSNTVQASQSPITDTGIVNVSADISGLTQCLIYHFRIKAENPLWINFYGSDQHFYITHLPTVETISVSGITATTAIVVGNITDDGGSAIVERGFILERRTGGTGSKLFKDDFTGDGRFTFNLSGLFPNTLYNVQAYAMNCLRNCGIGVANLSEGNIISFTTSQ